jgi:DNA invertase Pin-like site-specific DNA recombinase
MLRGAEAGEFKTLNFHSLSRLSRESVITMPMLKQLVYVHKVRIVSVTEGLDSGRDNWEVIASIMSLLHERYIKELSENVFRGQEGAVLAGLCVGDYRFGYKSVPIPGSERTRKGRHAKPRMTYVIDETTAPWVVRIFHWFVRERRSLRWITRELNRRGAPKDHRSSTKLWRHQLVANLLASEKYIGVWRWGDMQNSRVPGTGKIRQAPRPEEETEKWTRQFPHLKIVEVEEFKKAQELLQENYEKYAAHRRANGTIRWRDRGSADCPPRHLLERLVQCGECNSTFHVGGTSGHYLYCSGYPKGICGCKTQLRRERAERMILAEIGKRILADPFWFKTVYESALKSWQQHEEQTPAELAAAERALSDISAKIARLVDAIETGLDDPDLKARLEARRDERRVLAKTLDELRRTKDTEASEPTEEWVKQRLEQLHECLQGDQPAAAIALRELLGGKIVVSEIRGDGKRHRLQDRFTICAGAVAGLAAVSPQTFGKEGDLLSDEIVVEFVDPNPLDAEAEEAKVLYDQGLMSTDIARKLGCSKSKVTKLIRHWFEVRGEAMPDGRARRSQLDRQHTDPQLYQTIADDVKRLCDDGVLLQEIAERLDCDRNTVTKALRYWHTSRGLCAPDGRTRRKCDLRVRLARAWREKSMSG